MGAQISQLFSTPGSHPTLQGAARPVPALPSTTGASPRHRHTTSPSLASPGKANCRWVPQQAAHVVPVTHGCCGQHVHSFFCQNKVGWVWGHSSMFMAQEDVPRSYQNKIARGHWRQGWLRTRRTKKTFPQPHAVNCTWPLSDFPPSVPMAAEFGHPFAVPGHFNSPPPCLSQHSLPGQVKLR